MVPNQKLLDVIQIASPCHVSWDEMTGDDRIRHCAHCKLHVYNLAAMTANEAEDLLQAQHANGRVCVRLYRRPDGTILTQDCPVGWRLARRKLVGLATAISAFITFVVCGFAQSRSKENQSPVWDEGPLQAFKSAVDPEVAVMGFCVLPGPNP